MGQSIVWPLRGQKSSLFVVPVLVLLMVLPFLQSLAQAGFVALLAVAFLGMAWAGELCARWLRLHSLLDSPALFTRALLGQLVFVLAWLCAWPLTWAWSQLLGLPHPISFLVLAVLAASLFFNRTRLRQRSGAASLATTGAWLLVGVLALMVLAKAATHYSFTAGALGLDTHQHIAFALDMFNAGYPKLTAGHSDWVEKYPKMLHVIAALWAWPGFGAHIGPFLKIQPVLQATLALFAFIECVLVWMQRRQLSPLFQQLWAALLVVALGYMILRGTLFLYPTDDLNSTGRLAAISTLLLPVLAAMLCWQEPARSSRPWVLVWAMLPLAGAMAAKLNPSLAIAFVSFTLPAWVVTVAGLWWRAPGARGKLLLPALGTVCGGVVGCILLFSDPYYLQLLAETVPAVREFVQHTLGLQLLIAPAQLSTSIGVGERLMQVLPWELWYGPQPGMGVQMLPESPQMLGQRLLPVTRVLLGATLVLGAAMVTVAPERIRRRHVFSMLLVLQLALMIAVPVALRVSNIVTLTLGHETLEASLLTTYTQRYIGLLVMYVLMLHWTLMLATVVMAVDAVLQWRWPGLLQHRRWPRVSNVLMGLCAAIVVIAFVRVDIKGVTPADQGWTFPISEANVRAFQAAEAKLPQDAVVLAPAYAIVLNGREDWVLPSLYVTPYLPFAQRDYLFNIRLGAGYGFFAKDLRTMFCQSRPDEARAILRRAGVTHLLAHRWDGQSDSAVLDGQYCLTGYRKLGAEGAAVAQGPDGLVFYQLDP